MHTPDPMIVLLAGLAIPAAAAPAGAPSPVVPAIGVPTHDGPRRLTGHLYFSAGTGESVFTPAKEYLANRASRSFLAFGDDLNGDGVGDFYVNTNTDPCPLGTPTDPYISLGTLDYPSEDDPGVIVTGDHHLFKSQFGIYDWSLPPAERYFRDVRVNTLSFTFWTDLPDTDSDSDTLPDGNTAGVGIAMSFWDREDYIGKISCAPCEHWMTRRHIVTLNFTGLPGTLTPGELAGTVLTVELPPDHVFEIADSDGVGPASGYSNLFAAALDEDSDSDTVPDYSSADTDGNGTIDWSFSFQGIQPDDGRSAVIAYTLAAPGRFGSAGHFATDGVTPLNPQAGVRGDGLIDLITQTEPPAPLLWSNTRVVIDSIEPPMGRSGLPFTSGILPVPTALARFSWYLATRGEQPDPFGPPVTLSCPGIANSDFFGWGAVHPPNGQFYGDLNCTIDDDGDTVPEGRPWSAAFIAVSATPTCSSPCDYDANCTLNIDDIDTFVALYLFGEMTADCTGDGVLNVDDIDCFVSCFLAG